MSDATLPSGFLRSVAAFPDRPALTVNGEPWTYRRLYARAAAVAQALAGADQTERPLTAVLASRSSTAFAGVLAALLRGGGYVPLNPAFPAQRNRGMLERAACACVVVDARGQAQLEELLDGLALPRTFVLPECEDASALAARWPAHRFLGAADLGAADSYRPVPADPGAPAYLLFTSGSTGVPKGVAVSHRNVRHFLDVVVERYGITEHDRLTQMFDLTFDLSLFDMFVAWERGACVCCPTLQERALPGRFLRQSGATIWFSVPSTGLQMQRLRLLGDGQYPALRLSLFCGEALTADLAAAWARAAPNSVVENLYGPTELTIACTAYRWDAACSPSEVEHGVVPIGEPLTSLTALVADETLHEVAPGEIGELLVSGPQVALGYWQDTATTARAFVVPPGREAVFYRTGDRVRRPRRAGGPLIYLGRIDHQVKIQGYRVELGEIEAAVREESGVDLAVAVGWPRSQAGAESVVVFLEDAVDSSALRERLRARLPRYMVPERFVSLDRLPLNANGKVDRKTLLERLDAECP